jgi:hypothetical protein
MDDETTPRDEPLDPTGSGGARADDGASPPPGGWLVVPELPADTDLDDLDPDLVPGWDPDTLGAWQAAVRDIPPLDEVTRLRLVRLAGDAGPAPRSAGPPRTPWWRHPGLLAGAAALVVVAGIGSVISGGTDDDDDDASASLEATTFDDSAGGAASDTTVEADQAAPESEADAGRASDALGAEETAQATTEAATETTEAGDSTASLPDLGARPLGDLGAYDDVDALADDVAVLLDANVGTDGEVASTTAPAPTTTPSADGGATTCSPFATAFDPGRAVRALGTVTWRGVPAIVVVGDDELVVLDDAGCAELARTTLEP